MKRTQSSKHTSLRAAASTPLVYSDRASLTTSSSSTSSNAEWETVSVPTGASVSTHRGNRLLDMAALRESDLDNLKKEDPFMYYSLPIKKGNAYRPNLNLSRPTPTNNGDNNQSQSDDIRRNTSDSVLMVKRRSRISCEKHYDIDEMLEEIRELQARRPQRQQRLSMIDDCEESISEIIFNYRTEA